MNPDEPQKNRRTMPWEALRAHFARKRALPPSIAAVMSQWAEYELIFNDILQRLNAQLARQAKAEKKAFERLAREDGEGANVNGATQPPVAPVLTSKQQLRSAYAQQRFGGRIQALINAQEPRE